MGLTKPERDFVAIIHQKFGELSKSGRWSKEFRLMEWGKNEPKFDIRNWDMGYTDNMHAGKGISLTLDEVKELKRLLNEIDLDTFEMPAKKIMPTIL